MFLIDVEEAFRRKVKYPAFVQYGNILLVRKSMMKYSLITLPMTVLLFI